MSWSDAFPLFLQAKYLGLMVGELWFTLLLSALPLLVIYPLWRHYLQQRGKKPGRGVYLLVLASLVVGGKAILEIARNATVVKQQMVVEEHASRLRGSTLSSLDFLEKQCSYHIDHALLQFPDLPLNDEWVSKARIDAYQELEKSRRPRQELCDSLVRLIEPYANGALSRT